MPRVMTAVEVKPGELPQHAQTVSNILDQRFHHSHLKAVIGY
jgi:hypothetical protein